jgi:hypothetical protein
MWLYVIAFFGIMSYPFLPSWLGWVPAAAMFVLLIGFIAETLDNWGKHT